MVVIFQKKSKSLDRRIDQTQLFISRSFILFQLSYPSFCRRDDAPTLIRPERRIYTQTNVKTGGGGFLQALMTGSSGAEAGPNGPQQIISVDGVLLVTKYAGKGRTEALVKNYFAVWRRVEPGTYSSKR